jgi:hypothetical protein
MAELNTVQNEIRTLHICKAEHRKIYGSWIERTSYFYLGRQHCDRCREWSEEQKCLRNKKRKLCSELQRLSYGVDPIKLLKAEEEEKEKKI